MSTSDTLKEIYHSYMTNVLLLGAGGNAGINFIKSLRLGAKYIYVVGCDLDKYNLASCNSDKKILLKYDNEDEKVLKILDILQAENIDYLHAQPDSEVQFLLKHKDVFKKYIFNHSLDMWEKFANKLYCQQEWNKKLHLGFLSYPFSAIKTERKLFRRILKPSGKVWVRAIRGAGSRAALPVKTYEQALHWVQYWVEMKGLQEDDFMISEYLDGTEYAVQTLWIDGKVVQSQARERVVYFFGNLMPSGQSSTPAVAKTVDEKDVYRGTYDSIMTIDPKPHGIYCVDLKRNSQNKVIPMEVNYGRFFTTSNFFANIDVNTPQAVLDYFQNGKCIEAVEKIDTEYYWIRGLDKEPFLVQGKNLPKN